MRIARTVPSRLNIEDRLNRTLRQLESLTLATCNGFDVNTEATNADLVWIIQDMTADAAELFRQYKMTPCCTDQDGVQS